MHSKQPDVVLMQALAGQTGQLPVTALLSLPPALASATAQQEPTTCVLEVQSHLLLGNFCPSCFYPSHDGMQLIASVLSTRCKTLFSQPGVCVWHSA